MKYCGEVTFWNAPSSEAFIKNWVNFLELAKVTPTPILYQHVTDLVFREMVHNHFVGSRSLCDEGQPREVTQHEGSRLRYAGGYICRQLHKKIERGNHQFKELVFCLMTLVKDRSTDQECGNEEEWVTLMDRGGLWYLKETTYSLFISIEEEPLAYENPRIVTYNPTIILSRISCTL